MLSISNNILINSKIFCQTLSLLNHDDIKIMSTVIHNINKSNNIILFII